MVIDFCWVIGIWDLVIVLKIGQGIEGLEDEDY